MKKKIVSCFDIGEVPRSPGKWNWNWLYFLPFIFTFEQGVQSHNESLIPLQALETLRFISDLDDIDFPSDLIGVDIKKETIIYPEELHANDYEIEDLKPCIADLDLKSTIKVKKVTKKNGEPRKKRVRRKKGIDTQYDYYSFHTLHRGAFCQSSFWWIYYYGKNKSARPVYIY